MHALLAKNLPKRYYFYSASQAVVFRTLLSLRPALGEGMNTVLTKGRL